MAQPTIQECKDHFTGALDPDYLRVMKHMVDERLSMLDAQQPVHLRPMVSTPATAPSAEAGARKVAADRQKDADRKARDAKKTK